MASDIINSTLFQYADAALIFFYRSADAPLVGYFIGTSVLAFLCVLVGEFCVSLAVRVNRNHIEGMKQDIAAKEKLSVEAYESGDRSAYRALNKEATDAWGKQFFTMAAYSAGLLWPIPAALAWMDMRFHDVEFLLGFPLSLIFGDAAGYTFTFIPLYILIRILFKRIRIWMPYFRSVQQLLNACDAPAEKDPQPVRAGGA